METTIAEPTQNIVNQAIINKQSLLDHWLGHRNVSRRVIEAFPEDQLFKFSIGGMRTAAGLFMEIIHLGAPGIRGVVEGKWDTLETVERNLPEPKTKAALLAMYDAGTAEIVSLWSKITTQRFLEMDQFFGQYEGSIISSVMYVIDNEIHHRAQTYV